MVETKIVALTAEANTQLDNLSELYELPKLTLLSYLVLSIAALKPYQKEQILFNGKAISKLVELGAKVGSDGKIELPENLQDTIEGKDTIGRLSYE